MCMETFCDHRRRIHIFRPLVGGKLRCFLPRCLCLRCNSRLGLENFLLIFAKFLAKNQPPHPPPPHRIGTSHGGLRKFGYEVAKNTPFPPKNEHLIRTWDFEFWAAKNTPNQMQIQSELGTLSFRLPRIHSLNILVRNMVRTGVWRLTAVSPTNTV